MNYLSVPSSYTKQHNTNPFFFPETPVKNVFSMDNHNNHMTENNQIQTSCDQTKALKEVWSQHNFSSKTISGSISPTQTPKRSWAEQTTVKSNKVSVELTPKIPETKEDTKVMEQSEKGSKEDSPSHHARRPPNAFLIFCKKHRPIVRERFPNLENRGVTKILGEWWALLNNNQKQPYNDLAKEYKDAFLTANPNFRWYKLPAPPLRTFSTRPLTINKNPVPLSSPTSPLSSEFNLGKLADESQLGGLTSLMNNNYTGLPKQGDEGIREEPKFFEKTTNALSGSETESVKSIDSIPPKPIKKRFVELLYTDELKYSRTLSEEGESNEMDEDDSGNLTKQDLMNKVVDGIFAKHQDDTTENNGFKETRKSERICKGKRYEIFMIEGKLLGNKRDTKYQKHSKVFGKFDSEQNNNNTNDNTTIRKPETPKLDLRDTIKRLAERTNIKIDFESQVSVDCKEHPDQNEIKRVRSISETSESGLKEGSLKNSSPNFNLDLRISNLPCLSYDEFLQRKRESKKRKIRSKTDGEIKQRIEKSDNPESQLVGSKKRKNKHSITHFAKKDVTVNNELFGLETLAEVAANTQKINEEISMN